MTLDERLEALTMNLELTAHAVEELRGVVTSLVGTVEKLVTVMQSHERRITDLEGNA
jgi:uncharacterized coiled-coil protein SlyX